MPAMDYRQKCLNAKGEKCIICGEMEEVIVHHVDGDRANNALSNLIPLCRYCHTGIHRQRENYEHWTKKLPSSEINPADSVSDKTKMADDLIFLEDLPSSDAKIVVGLDPLLWPAQCPHCDKVWSSFEYGGLMDRTSCYNCLWTGRLYEAVKHWWENNDE